MYLSFDVGGTNTKYSLINKNGEILKSGSIVTQDNRDIIFGRIKEVVKKFQNEDKLGFNCNAK